MYGKKNTVLCYNQTDNKWQLPFNISRKHPPQFSSHGQGKKMVSDAFAMLLERGDDAIGALQFFLCSCHYSRHNAAWIY